jgi:hypothetical protein
MSQDAAQSSLPCAERPVALKVDADEASHHLEVYTKQLAKARRFQSAVNGDVPMPGDKAHDPR